MFSLEKVNEYTFLPLSLSNSRNPLKLQPIGNFSSLAKFTRKRRGFNEKIAAYDSHIQNNNNLNGENAVKSRLP